MEHRIIITKTQVVSVFKDLDAMDLYISGLIHDRIAFSYEFS